MADKSAIEWTDATWNPIVGCSIVSPGCTHCYAMGMAARIEAMTAALTRTGQGGAPHYNGTTRKVKGTAIWTGKVALAPEKILLQPLAWRAPRKIFVNSMGDLFHEDVPDAWIDKVFAVMALAPQHTFQVLTKRKRMREYMNWQAFDRVVIQMMAMVDQGTPSVRETCERHGIPWQQPRSAHDWWPLRNVWLGVSAERQQEADERVPALLATPAAVRFISAEPLLGPIDFTSISGEAPNYTFRVNALSGRHTIPSDNPTDIVTDGACLDWIIVGGESGPDARPMHPDWVRDVRDDCAAANVAFFFKQWGEWAPGELAPRMQVRTERAATFWNDKWLFENVTPAAGQSMHSDDEPDVFRFGKRGLGRSLDGVEHNAMPEAR
ncbi:phage Gp37/Gp68 family protein [Mesorhizobium sp. M0129]|uniref:DUF5131 family protein n=1 Tax=Mesorhizobium sp. M0129 TaxID=2956886 RepID=UPI003336001F